MKHPSHVDKTGSTRNSFYKLGGSAALIAGLVFRQNMGAEFSVLRSLGIIGVGPMIAPKTAIEWFNLIQSNKVVALILLEFVDIINYALVSLIFLALYYALKGTNESVTGIATIFGIAGTVVYFASNQTFAMLSLSDQYAAATTDAQKAVLLAAGEAILAIHNPGAIYQGTGIYLSIFLIMLCRLIISLVMLQSTIFSKKTAYIGIVASGSGLGQYIALIFFPSIIFLLPSISGLFITVWHILIGRRLFQLAKE